MPPRDPGPLGGPPDYDWRGRDYEAFGDLRAWAIGALIATLTAAVLAASPHFNPPSSHAAKVGQGDCGVIFNRSPAVK